jgi:hypothetical protein
MSTTNPDQPETQPSPRKRGAPNGNRNAVKHGFYSRAFTTQEIDDIDEEKPLNLTDEINLVRIFMRRVITSFDNSNATQQDLLDTFRAICVGNMTLTRLIRIQLLPAMEKHLGNSIEEFIKQVLIEVQSNTYPQTEGEANNFLSEPYLPTTTDENPTLPNE